MSPIEFAAVLAAVVLVAAMVSVELGVTVALIELTLGIVVGNVFDLGRPTGSTSSRSSRSIVLTFLAGMEVDPATCADGCRHPSGSALPPSPGRSSSPRSRRTSSSGGPEGLTDRRDGAVDDLARSRLCRARRARADDNERREAADERNVRDGHLHGDRAVGDLHQAERLVPGLSSSSRSR